MRLQIKSNEELGDLPVGTILTHKSGGSAYVIVGHDGTGFPICVRQITATNAEEWEVFIGK